MGIQTSKQQFSGDILNYGNTPSSALGNFIVAADVTKPSKLIDVLNLSGEFVGYLTVPSSYLVSASTSSAPLTSASITYIDPVIYQQVFRTITTFSTYQASISSPYITRTNNYQVELIFTPCVTSSDPIELPEVLFIQTFTFEGNEMSKSFVFVYAYVDPQSNCLKYRASSVIMSLSQSPNQLGQTIEFGPVTLQVSMTYQIIPEIYPVFNGLNPLNLTNNLGTLSCQFTGSVVNYTRMSSSSITPISTRTFVN